MADPVVDSAPAARRQGWYRRLRERIRRNPALNQTWRIGVLVTGGLVILAGLAMLVLPGPGWAAVFVGLAILATEFAWAKRLLDRTRARVRGMAEKALDPKVRRRNQIIAAVTLVVLVAGFVLLMRAFGVPGILDPLVPDAVAE